jgi:hypothetical protein
MRAKLLVNILDDDLNFILLVPGSARDRHGRRCARRAVKGTRRTRRLRGRGRARRTEIPRIARHAISPRRTIKAGRARYHSGAGHTIDTGLTRLAQIIGVDILSDRARRGRVRPLEPERPVSPTHRGHGAIQAHLKRVDRRERERPRKLVAVGGLKATWLTI